MMEEEGLQQKISRVIYDLTGNFVKINSVRYEGPYIVIYTDNISFFLESDNYIAEIAKVLKERVVIRLERSLLLDPKKAKGEIEKIVQKEANIERYYFDSVFGEVIIEAGKPGLVIGQKGENLQKIKERTLWTPKVIRKPVESKIVKSSIIHAVRHIVYGNSAQRLSFYTKAGGRIHRIPVFKNSWVRMISLGGSKEVGRSCFLLQTQESNILLDCGINLGSKRDFLPYLGAPELDIDELDAVVVSHAHLDHCGAVPLLFKYGYRGPVYCTEPTRDLMALLQLDYIEVARKEGRPLIYTFKDIEEELLHTIPLEYETVTNISPEVKITFYNAGHVLGSAITHIHIGEGLHNIVYTGDFKFERTLLLERSEHRFPRLETLIMESTYGSVKNILPPREKSEALLIEYINKTLRREGTVLIPVLGVGRAQEILLILEKNFNRKKLIEAPVYVDGMIAEANAIHTTYPSFLSESLRNKILHRSMNPFTSELFTPISSREARLDILQQGSAIILATSGMLTGGPSVEYFKNMASDQRNSIIFVSYQVNGTLGREVQRQGKGGNVYMTNDGRGEIIRIEMDVYTVEGFSGHSDWMQLLSYAGKIQPKPSRVIIVHGEKSKSQELAHAIRSMRKIETTVPTNLEGVRLC